MKLKEYLDSENLKVSDLARATGVKHCVAMRWVTGETIPSRENMQKIVLFTENKVNPNDFYGVFQHGLYKTF